MAVTGMPARTLDSARDELKMLVARSSKVSRRWLFTYVESEGLPDSRVELHVLEGSPDLGWVIVDWARKRVQAFQGGRRIALVDLEDGGQLTAFSPAA